MRPPVLMGGVPRRHIIRAANRLVGTVPVPVIDDTYILDEWSDPITDEWGDPIQDER